MKKGIKRRLLAGLLAAALLLPQAVVGDTGSNPIEQYVGAPTTAEQKAQLITSKYGADSLQYALIDNGEIVRSGHSGVYSKSENRALTGDVMYGTGSVSKMFTTAILMKLTEEGKIHLDKPVTTYLPEFRMADGRYRQITVRMLLNHSSGLMGSSLKNGFLFDDRDTSATDDLLTRLKGQSLKADPGAYSVYCNDGFTLAELVAEQVTGKTYTSLLAEYITKPLEMANTKTPLDSFDRSQLAKTYTPGIEKELPVDSAGIIGTGGVYSTAEDMCRFAQIFMEGDGKTGAGGVLSPSTAEQTAQREFASGIWPDKESPDADGYGLGWDGVNGYHFAQYGMQELYKGGDTFFYHASLVVLPEQNMAAAVLSSGGSSVYDQLLAESLLEERLAEKGLLPAKISKDTGADVMAGGNEAQQAMPEELMKNSGYYGNLGGITKIEVSKDGKLSITIPGNDMYAESYTYVPGSAAEKEGPYFTDQTKLVKVSFVKESNEKTYVKVNGPGILPGLGVSMTNQYTNQKLESVEVSADVLKSWNAREGKKYYALDEKYTSSMYLITLPGFKLLLQDELPGYVGNGVVSGPDDTKTVLQIPGVMGRDLMEMHFFTKDGKEYITDYDNLFVGEEAIPYMEREKISDDVYTTLQIGKDGYARWMRAGNLAGRAMTVKVPEKGAFFVYDDKNVCVNNSLVSGVNTVVLPEGGMVCLAGDPEQVFGVTLEAFADVLPGAWYYDAVGYMTGKKLASGTEANRFGPEDEMSRAMLVTILNKMGQNEPAKYGVNAGEPTVFSDVPKGSWYADAAAWAGGAGIVSGTGKDQEGASVFSPDETVSREQLVTILYQYAQKIGRKTPAEETALHRLSDSGQVADWARTPMSWAIGQGLISGKAGDGGEMRLDPQGKATRAEASIILMKFMEADSQISK